jgi:hypothetical protein
VPLWAGRVLGELSGRSRHRATCVLASSSSRVRGHRDRWRARQVPRRLLINSVLAFVFALCETARYARYEQSES